jgi:hypothetical protein
MKKLLPILSIVFLAVFMVACNQAPKPNVASQQAPVITADTTGLANFQLWKAQNELANVQQFNQPVSAAPQQEKQVIVYRDAPAKSRSTSSKSASSKSSSSQSQPAPGNSGVSNDEGVASSTGSNEAKTVAKKGISKAAKGAIIGGVGGAVAGAIINKKNRVAGAVIGGVIGAGGGYAIGRGMDKKDGRVGSGTSTPPFSIPTGILQK